MRLKEQNVTEKQQTVCQKLQQFQICTQKTTLFSVVAGYQEIQPKGKEENENPDAATQYVFLTRIVIIHFSNLKCKIGNH